MTALHAAAEAALGETLHGGETFLAGEQGSTRVAVALATAPRDLACAFPGVVACVPAEVRSGRRHPLRPGVGDQLLIKLNFTFNFFVFLFRCFSNSLSFEMALLLKAKSFYL